MTQSQKLAASRILHAKLRALGLSGPQALECVGCSLRLARHMPAHLAPVWFRLRRAEFYARTFGTRG